MRRRENRKLIPIFRIAIVLLILGFFSTIFSLIYATNANIINHISISHVEVSGLSRIEATQKLEEILNRITKEEMILKHGENEKRFTLQGMELETDVIEKVGQACKIGRSKNIISNNYQIITALLKGEDLKLELKFNEEILQSIFSNLDEEWEDTFIDNSYYIEGDKLVVVKGKTGIIVDENALREEIEQFAYDKIEGKDRKEIEIPVLTKEPEPIEMEKIQKEIYKEAQNASYDKNTAKLTVHSNGIDLAISMEEAKNMVSDTREEVVLPLKVTKPEITTDMLGEEAFPNVLGSFSTRYDASNKNRATNIELAAKAIDGKILLPGEKFSFNSVVGPTTAGKGYLLAGAYSAGELVENYGGGICQVSSTLYNVALYANLEIVERYNHSSVVSYVDPGRDATISYGAKDFKFSNPRKYAIKINIKATNGILETEIRGIAEDKEYEIEIVSEKTATIPCTTKYVYDTTLAPEEEYVQTMGANGAKSIAYRIIKKNGKILSKTVLSEDSYNPMTKVIRTGNKNHGK